MLPLRSERPLGLSVRLPLSKAGPLVGGRGVANRPYVRKDDALHMAGLRALGRLPKGQKNKMEQAYEDRVLKPALSAGDILWYRFEAIKLRLADKTFYEPDYFVMRKTGALEVHEVKGRWMDDARVKIKVAASQYPFEFIAVTRNRGAWKEERF